MRLRGMSGRIRRIANRNFFIVSPASYG